MRYKSVYDCQLRDIIWFVITYRYMYCIFIKFSVSVSVTVSMWSFHDRLLLTVTHNSLTVEQDLITESWYGISVLDCRIRRFCLELINIKFDLSEFMDIWLCWHHISTCDKLLISAHECDRTKGKSLIYIYIYIYISKIASNLGQKHTGYDFPVCRLFTRNKCTLCSCIALLCM